VKRILIVILFSIIQGNAFAVDDLGKVTYQIACSNCHALNYSKAMGSPAVHDKKAWKQRFKNAQQEVKRNPHKYKTSLDYLLHSVINGKKLMHHGGLCHESNVPKRNCSDAAFVAAIQYMSQ
jgi:cytochrome c5